MDEGDVEDKPGDDKEEGVEELDEGLVDDRRYHKVDWRYDEYDWADDGHLLWNIDTIIIVLTFTLPRTTNKTPLTQYRSTCL